LRFVWRAKRFSDGFKHFRPIATRYEKLAENDLALVYRTAIRLIVTVLMARPA
jgi:hypothetical protein